MRGLTRYGAIATKIRGMESRLLTKDDYETLAGMASIPDAVEYLSRIPAYRSVLEGRELSSVRRSDMERLMRGALYYDFSKLYQFGDREQKALLKLYFRKYEIDVIKRAMRRVFNHGGTAGEMDTLRESLQRFTEIHVEEMLRAQTVTDLIYALRDTDYGEALERLGVTEDTKLFDCEMILDLFYFTEVWKRKDKLLKGRDRELLTESFGIRIDLLNMTWIYRAKKYYRLSIPSVYALLIPLTYRLRENDIRTMVTSESMEALDEAIRNTRYGHRFRELGAAELERFYHELLRRLYLEEKHKNPYSVAVITSYLYEKEEEIRRLTTVLEGIRYGLPKEKTLEYLSAGIGSKGVKT